MFLKEGISVHSLMTKLGLKCDLFLNNNLISLYSKRFLIRDARRVFDEMVDRDVVSWTGIVSAYVKNNEEDEALSLYSEMVNYGFVPNQFTFASVLRACSALEAHEPGICTHCRIVKHGFESNLVLGSALIDFYSKCDLLSEAMNIFIAMVYQDTITYTTMISAFTQAGNFMNAFELYSRMRQENVSANQFTFVGLLKASSSLGTEHGQIIHSHLIQLGIPMNLVLTTSLIDMYSKLGHMEDAMKVLNGSPESDVFSWTTIISGHIQDLDFEKAVSSFRSMELAGIRPNSFTYSSLLKIHARVILPGLLNGISIGNGLVDMYMKCFTVKEACRAFMEMEEHDVVPYTSLIAGLSHLGLNHEALQAYGQMKEAGIQPNSYTFSSILGACAGLETCNIGKQFHACIIKIQEIYKEIAVSNALVDMYARLGQLGYASNVVKTMVHKDAVTYTTLISGNNQMDLHRNALDVIVLMRDDDIELDGHSVAGLLSASAGLASLETGKQLHCHCLKSRSDCRMPVGNGILDMYAKCGSIEDAKRAFMELPGQPDLVSWNALIAGFASHGLFSDALSSFEDMRLSGIKPDHITLLIVLYACSHAGLVDLGIEYFELMQKNYQINRTPDHYVCIIDLLGRAERLEDALEVIRTMPFEPNALMYKTLLSACKIYKNLGLGEYAAGSALELDENNPAVYVLLSNMYDEAGMSNSGDEIRQLMRNRGLKKNPGQSWLEIRSKVYSFGAGDHSNPQTRGMHEKLEELTYSYHSEKLTMAFGLLNLPVDAPVRIIKNLRTCIDCHSFMALVTKLLDREIVVRDSSRFHTFREGICTCGGYW
ncbi:hypothetical protein AMTRI_Chr01g115180 [Amborella trichopoda]